MQQHPIPRQVTTFEFKLIGFLTLKQFIYLVMSVFFGIVLYYLFPLPVLNIVVAVLMIVAGVVFAFVPIYDRPAEVWIKNLYRSLTSPTQYIYKKNNTPLYFFDKLVFVSDPHKIMAHVESRKKLAQYLQTKYKEGHATGDKEAISSLFQGGNNKKVEKRGKIEDKGNGEHLPSKKDKPFLFGVVKNNKQIPLPGMLVYIYKEKGKPLRLMKTNVHGVFATFRELEPGSYFVEVKDPEKKYFFDRMEIKVDKVNKNPLEIHSKELL